VHSKLSTLGHDCMGLLKHIDATLETYKRRVLARLEMPWSMPDEAQRRDWAVDDDKAWFSAECNRPLRCVCKHSVS
jgi:hypothetical protein